MPMPRLFVNALTHLDVSLFDPEAGLVGMTWLADVELGGDLDEQGMVLDFGTVKQAVKRRIDQEFDHRLLVPTGFLGCALDQAAGLAEVEWRTADGGRWRHQGPAAAVREIAAERAEASVLEQAITADLRAVLPGNVRTVGVRLRPETDPAAVFFRYSHGLKRHGGNCQRIAHGHRSRLEIFRNGARDSALERAWGARWRDIYLAQREDLAGATDGRLIFDYQAGQGDFRLELPADRCYLTDQPTTIENLASHLAARLKAAEPEARFAVRLYEGVDKGAAVETE